MKLQPNCRLTVCKTTGLVVVLALGWLSPWTTTTAVYHTTSLRPARVQTGPFKNHRYETIPVAGYTGPEFQLSQAYPATRPTNEAKPWEAFSFRTQPEEYLRSVLAYAMEGNVAVDWVGQNNAVRQWYHAPWLDAGNNGREFVHGLTLERASRPRELHPAQTSFWANYAVGLNNPLGGYTIGQVWADPNNPNAAAARFPNG